MINTPLSRDAGAERAARSGGNLTSSGAGGNRPTRNVLCPSCRARTSTREMKGKMGSGAHCPGLPTVDYSTTSPGGDSRSFRQHASPTLSDDCRWPTNTRTQFLWCAFVAPVWGHWLAVGTQRGEETRWLCRLLADRGGRWRWSAKGPALVLALLSPPAVSCSATHNRMKEKARTCARQR